MAARATPRGSDTGLFPRDAAQPMTREAVIAKFARFAGPTLGARAEAVAAGILDGAAGARLDPFSPA